MVFPALECKNRKADYVPIDKSNPKKYGTPAVPDSWLGLRNNLQYYHEWAEKRPDLWELVM
jgi:hypothetical protein